MERKTCKKKLKLLFLGNSTVGKTSILKRFTDEPFNEDAVLTIGINQRVKFVEINQTKVKLELWDTAGQERFHSIAKNYIRGGHGFIFIYAINDIDSFKGIKKWIKEAQKVQSIKSFQMIIVGNKCDLVNAKDTDRNKEIEVTQQELKQLSNEFGVSSIEASAKQNVNIDKIFQLLLSQLMEHQHELGDVSSFGDSCIIERENTSTVAGASNRPSKCEC